MLVVGGTSLTEAFDVDHAQRTRGRQPSAELAIVVDPLPLVRYEEEGVAVLRSLADIRLDGPGPDQQQGLDLLVAGVKAVLGPVMNDHGDFLLKLGEKRRRDRALVEDELAYRLLQIVGVC